MKKIFIIIIFSIIFQKNAYSETKKYWIDRDYVCNEKVLNFSLLQPKSNSWARVKKVKMGKDHIGFGTTHTKGPKGEKVIVWGETHIQNDGKGRLVMFFYNTKNKKLNLKAYYLNISDVKQLKEAQRINDLRKRAEEIFKLKIGFYKLRVEKGGRYEDGTYTCDYR